MENFWENALNEIRKIAGKAPIQNDATLNKSEEKKDEKKEEVKDQAKEQTPEAKSATTPVENQKADTSFAELESIVKDIQTRVTNLEAKITANAQSIEKMEKVVEVLASIPMGKTPEVQASAVGNNSDKKEPRKSGFDYFRELQEKTQK